MSAQCDRRRMVEADVRETRGRVSERWGVGFAKGVRMVDVARGDEEVRETAIVTTGKVQASAKE
jgi:hypothetical protein